VAAAAALPVGMPRRSGWLSLQQRQLEFSLSVRRPRRAAEPAQAASGTSRVPPVAL